MYVLSKGGITGQDQRSQPTTTEGSSLTSGKHHLSRILIFFPGFLEVCPSSFSGKLTGAELWRRTIISMTVHTTPH